MAGSAVSGTVLCHESAWEYWRTPPALRDAVIPPELACVPAPEGCGLPDDLLALRASAREADRLVRPRLLTDLKGVRLPAHVLVDERVSRRPSSYVVAHQLGPDLQPDDVVDIGGGLAVTAPAATLRQLGKRLSVAHLALRMFEACGIYAVPARTPQLTWLIGKLLEHDGLALADGAERVTHAFEADGRRTAFTSRFGKPLPWTPCFDRLGRPTGLWKCPPLLTVEELAADIARVKGARGASRARQALALVRDGSGSPLESKACLMLFGTRWKGGEGLAWPSLNRRVDYTPEASLLGHGRWCAADMLFADPRVIIEVNGEAYHADRQGFKLASGRTAALESMGYRVIDLTYEQLADLERFDAWLMAFSHGSGVELKPKTAAFLRHRDAWHHEIFCSGV